MIALVRTAAVGTATHPAEQFCFPVCICQLWPWSVVSRSECSIVLSLVLLLYEGLRSVLTPRFQYRPVDSAYECLQLMSSSRPVLPSATYWLCDCIASCVALASRLMISVAVL